MRAVARRRADGDECSNAVGASQPSELPNHLARSTHLGMMRPWMRVMPNYRKELMQTEGSELEVLVLPI